MAHHRLDLIDTHAQGRGQGSDNGAWGNSGSRLIWVWPGSRTPRMARRALLVLATVAVLVGLVLVYLFAFLTAAPPALSATVQNGSAHLTLETVPAYGHSPDPDWVS